MSKDLEKRLDEIKEKAETALKEIAVMRAELTAAPVPKAEMKDIHTWEDVAKAYNIDPVKSLPYPTPADKDEENTNAFFMAKRVVKLANNDPAFPDYKNSNQDKFSPGFDMRDASGVGVSDSSYDNWDSGSYVGARLSWKNYDTMVATFNKPGLLKIWQCLMT